MAVAGDSASPRSAQRDRCRIGLPAKTLRLVCEDPAGDGRNGCWIAKRVKQRGFRAGLPLDIEEFPKFVSSANVMFVLGDQRPRLEGQVRLGKNCPVGLIEPLQVDRAVTAAERIATNDGTVTTAMDDLVASPLVSARA